MNDHIQILMKPSTKPAIIACDKCRGLKVKCIRPADDAPCVKCTKSNLQCIVSKPKRSAKANQRANPRIADLEGKLNGILGLLSRSNTVTSAETCFIPSSEPSTNIDYFTSFPGPLDGDATGHLAEKERGSPNSIKTMEFNAYTKAPETYPNSDNIRFTRLELRPVILDHLLNEFRKMQSYCPFVVIRKEWTNLYMTTERPFLLLAAIISASSKYPQLQRALTAEFKETLANRVIISEDRSLDLLQGLLVHLTWFQFHLVPRSQQIYRYLQIAISVMIDLGLDQKFDNVIQERSDLLLRDPSLRSRNVSSVHLLGNEGRRATLGCYYLSTIVSFFSGKPNNLPFTQHMLGCAIFLQQSPEFESDHLVYPLIKLQRVVEEARDLYRIDKTTNSGARTHTHAERLIMNLEEWRHALPLNIQHSALIENRYYAVKIRIYEMGLVYKFESLRPLARNKNEKDNPITAPNALLIANLIKCVDAVKEYLDSFLAMSISGYHSLPLEEWLRVILAFFVLYKLSVGLSEVPAWNADIARETADLETYLSLFLNRLKLAQPIQISLSTNSADNLFSIFPLILENVKDSYMAARDNPSLFSDGIIAHDDLGALKAAQNCPSTSSPSWRTNERVRCPGTSDLNALARPTHLSSSTGIAAEIQTIENEKLWDDLMMDDAMAYSFNGSQAVHH